MPKKKIRCSKKKEELVSTEMTLSASNLTRLEKGLILFTVLLICLLGYQQVKLSAPAVEPTTVPSTPTSESLTKASRPSEGSTSCRTRSTGPSTSSCPSPTCCWNSCDTTSP